MRRFVAPLVLLVALTTATTPARAETVEQAYAGALKSYYAGKYQAAVQALERLVALPLHHEELFYDLGCAYFRLGRLGPAIYNYERALALDAGFEDARYNLDLAREPWASASKTCSRALAVRPGGWASSSCSHLAAGGSSFSPYGGWRWASCSWCAR